MKKIFLLLFVCIFALGFSQKKKKTKSKAVVEKKNRDYLHGAGSRDLKRDKSDRWFH